MVQSTGVFSDSDFAQKANEALALWQPAISLPVAMTAEMLRFAGRRMSAQAEYLADIARCKSFAEALNSQSAFLQSAASEYRAEAEVLLKEIQEAAPSLKAAA
jgi:hypothetical protein